MRLPIVPLILLLTFSAVLAPADELAEKGRQIFKKNQRAIVTVQAVIKMKVSFPGMGGESSEVKQDLTGTVIDPSGLTVLALSAVEPGDMLANLMSGMGEEGSRIKMDTEISDLKILLDDGSEMPADVVLRDKELDLAFVRPKIRPATPMVAVDLSKSAKVDVLDQVITLNRLGNAAGRAYAASVERINAVVQKPRLFYVPGSEASSTAMGSPAFTLEGNVLGVFVTRSLKQSGGGGMAGLLSSRPEGLTPIILPSEEIQKAAKQAAEIKVTEEIKEEVKTSEVKKEEKTDAKK